MHYEKRISVLRKFLKKYTNINFENGWENNFFFSILLN